MSTLEELESMTDSIVANMEYTEGLSERIQGAAPAMAMNAAIGQSGGQSSEIGRNVAGIVKEPIENVVDAARIGYNKVIGDDEAINQIAEAQGIKDVMRYGASPYELGQANPRTKENLGRELPAYLTPEVAFKLGTSAVKGASRMVIESIAKRSALRGSLSVEQRVNDMEKAAGLGFTYKGKKYPSSKISPEMRQTFVDAAKTEENRILSVNELMKKSTGTKEMEAAERAEKMIVPKAIGASLRTDVLGTAGITDAYRPEEGGGFTFDENYGKNLAIGMAANAIPSLMITGPLSLRASGKAAGGAKQAQALMKDIANQDKLSFNMDRATIAEYANEYYNGSVHKDMSGEELYNDKAWGVHQIDGVDNEFFLVSERLGALRLKEENGAFVIEKGKGTYITNDIYMMKTGDTPLLTPYSPVSEFGYNSLQTDMIDIKAPGSGDNINYRYSFSGESANKESFEIAQNTKSAIFKDKKGDLISSPGGVKVKRTIPKDVSISSMVMRSTGDVDGLNALLQSNLDSTSKNAIEAAGRVRDTANALYTSTDGTNYRDVIHSKVKNDVLASIKEIHGSGSETADIIESLFKVVDQGKGKEVVGIKGETSAILEHAIDSALIKLKSSMKVLDRGPDGKMIVLEADKADGLANSIVTDLLDISGVERSGTMDAVKTQLATKLREKGIVKTILSDKKSTIIKDKDGNLGNYYTIYDRKFSTDSSGNSVQLGEATDTPSLAFDSEMKTSDYIDEINAASNSVNNDIHRFSSITGKRKNGVTFNDPNRGTTIIPADPTDKLYWSRLDNKSLPVNPVGSTGKTYTAMANTPFFYRGGTKNAKALIDRIYNMEDAQLAYYTKLIDTYEPGQKLSDLVPNEYTYSDILSSLQEFRNELNEHRFFIDRTQDGDLGMHFPVTRVSTNRMQFTGYINPHQGMFSKMLFTTDKHGFKISDASQKKVFNSYSVRSVLDEIPEIKDLLSQELKDKYKLNAPTKSNVRADQFSIKKWTLTADEISGLEKDLYNAVLEKFKSDPTIKNFDDILEKGNLTLKEFTAYRTLKAINEDDISSVIIESDAVTSSRGSANIIFKKRDPNTGIDSTIDQATSDIYLDLGYAIQENIGDIIQFSRDELKNIGQGITYEQSPYNAAVLLLENKLKKLYNKAAHEVKSGSHDTESITQLENIRKNLSANIDMDKGAIGIYNALIKKIDKLESFEKIAEAFRVEKFNIDDMYIDAELSGATARASATARTLNNLDALEGKILRIKGDIKTKTALLDEITATKNGIKLMNILNKLKKKDYSKITIEEAEVAARYFANENKHSIEAAINKTLGPEYMKLQHDVSQLFDMGYAATKKLMKETMLTDKFKKTMFKELGIKGKEKKIIEASLPARGSTIDDFVDLISFYGKDPMLSRTFYNMLPKVSNIAGDEFAYIVMKGTGYDPLNSLTYGAISPVTSASPFLLHSIDSSNMGFASRDMKPLNQRWDAHYDLSGINHGIDANTAAAWMYGAEGTNQYKIFRDAYNDLENIFNTNLDKSMKKEIIADTARRKVVQGTTDVTQLKNKIEGEAENLKGHIFGSKKLYSNIDKTSGEIGARLDDIRRSDSELTFQHYTNGAPESIVKTRPSDLDKLSPEIKTDFFNPNSMGTSFDVNHLKNVDTTGMRVNQLSGFKIEGLTNRFISDVDNIQSGASATFDSISNTITISTTIDDPSFFRQLAHEGVHQVGTKVYDAVDTAKTFGDIKKALMDKGFKIAIKQEDGTWVTPSDDQLLVDISISQNANSSPLDPAIIQGNEISASMLDRLLSNEMVMSRKSDIALLRKKSDLRDMVEPLVMQGKDRPPEELYTIADLNSFLIRNGIDGYRSIINEYAGRTLGLLDSSFKIKDVILGKNIDPFVSTLNNIDGYVGPLRKSILATNTQLQKLPFADFMALDKKQEALFTALGMQKSIDEQLTKVTSKSAEHWQKLFDDKFGESNSVKMAHRFGNAWSMGLNKLIYGSLKDSKRFAELNFTMDNLQKIGTGRIKEVMKKNIDTTFNKLRGHSDIPEMKARSKSIQKRLKRLVDGYSRKDFSKIVHDIKELNDLNNGKKLSYNDAHMITRKIASMYLIGKHTSQFKDIYQVFSTNPQAFEEFMHISNKHENPYTMFGENPEFQFADGKHEAKAINAKKAKKLGIEDSDIVARIKDKKGNDMVVISKEKADRYIGKQESQFINVNLSKLERGFLKADGLYVSPQNVIGDGTKFVNNSIVKMLARNVWSNMKEDIARDLSYRQARLLIDQNILLSESARNIILEATPDAKFVKLNKGNPLRKALGSNYYFDVRYQHYFNGTEGVNVGSGIRSILGDTEMSKAITGIVVTMAKYLRDLRGTILLARPNSYINSFISSALIAWQHSDSYNPAKYLFKANKAIKDYQVLIENFAKTYADDPVKGLEYWNNTVKKDPLHTAVENGIINTIRADAYKINTTPHMQLYNAVKDATGSDAYANVYKSIMLAPDSRIGNGLGSIFDMTELVPKIALYLDKIDSKLSPQIAAQHVTMAFPLYHNLPHGADIIDNFMPYTKFALSTPRMIMYGINQNKTRTLSLLMASKTLPAASFALATDDEKVRWKWFMDQGFIKVPFIDRAYPNVSLFPTVSMPFYNPFHDGILDLTAVYSMTHSLLDPVKTASIGSALPGEKK